MNDQLTVSRLYFNGTVHTMDPHRSIAEAVVTTGNRIVAVGSFETVRRRAPAGTELVDMNGAVMTPGLVDTHPHMMHWSWTDAMTVSLWNCRNHNEIVARIREAAEKTPDGQMIVCSPIGEPHFFHASSYRDLEEGVLPDRYVLDTATTDHPVAIIPWAPVRPSVMALNSKGLELLAITSESSDRTDNVWIDKFPDGTPTGRLSGSLMLYYGYDATGNDLITRLAAHFKYEIIAQATVDGIEKYKRLGITTVYENHQLDREFLDIYRRLRADRALEMRVVASQEAEMYGFAWARPREDDDFYARLSNAKDAISLSDDRFRVNGVTIAWDGYCYGGTMMMREPYLDVYGKLTYGQRSISPERAEYVMRFCAENNMRLNILAMGLKAHDEVLALLERLDPEISVAEQNWILCHATTIENNQIDRYRALNFSHTTSMAFGCGEGDLISRTMGRWVREHIHPLRHFFDVNISVGGGTDWGPVSPWAQMELALTHEFMESGYRNIGPNQRVSRQEALAMFTSDAAKVLQWDEIGSITAGSLADLVIVDRDPITCDIDDLHKIRALTTIFDGEPLTYADTTAS
ncbi:amidohydrolase [Nocardia aobensis]|uniref:amidohydrolase n=1 Tax=Nocardia aobensis TaxID=257277 RepID=UPI0002EB8516|nr:amidohydrolase family protein [Nocardia aobensis]